MRIIKYTIFTILLSSCAATGPVFSPADFNDSSKVLVYIYKVSEEDQNPSIFAHNFITVDGQVICSLSEETYTYVILNPGTHEFGVRSNEFGVPGFKLASVSEELKPGHIYYYRYEENEASTEYASIGGSNIAPVAHKRNTIRLQYKVKMELVYSAPTLLRLTRYVNNQYQAR